MNSTTFLPEPVQPRSDRALSRELLGLVVVWLGDEPERVGEGFWLQAHPSTAPVILGRGGPRPEDGATRLLPCGLRPGWRGMCRPLNTPTLSRQQLRVEVRENKCLHISNIGKAAMRVGGKVVSEALLAPGELLELEGQLTLLCVARTEVMISSVVLSNHPFGQADLHGMVGESEAIWSLREQLTFVAGRAGHVLLQGESGTGKELAAMAIHASSPRSQRPLIARNAATFPEGLIDAELFGNVRNFPNVGMPERPGLIGEADGSTLFLDEFGELSAGLQTHLLRVLDQGEYQRLGESKVRWANLRLVAATNRPEGVLKHDVLARFTLRLSLPGLQSRLEDIPLLTRQILRDILARDPDLMTERFGGQVPRLSQTFTYLLMCHPYTTHYRELERWLWLAVSEAKGPVLDAPRGLARLGPSLQMNLAPLDAAPSPLVPRSPPLPPLEVESLGHLDRQLEPQERLLLKLLRRHHLNVTDASADPESPVKRVAVDVCLRVIMFKALILAEWDLEQAVIWLDGGDNVLLRERFRKRLETSVSTLQHRARKEGALPLRRKLMRAYGGSFTLIEQVLMALERDKIRGLPVDPTTLDMD